MTDHVPDCPVPLHDPRCPQPYKLAADGKHWWSGWPGAFCLGCGCSDPMEICVATCIQPWEEVSE